MRLSLIAAVARNGAIGQGNDLLWNHPLDQKHFRQTTMGCPVIMGRRTWDSLPARFRPLPGRRNIVVTRNTGWQDTGAEVAHSLDGAIALLGDEVPRAFVIGGGELYALAAPLASELVLTEVDADFKADTFFPDWDRAAFTEVSREAHPPVNPGDIGFAFVTYQRSSG